MKDSVYMTIATFIEYLSEGQMNTCSNWKEVSRLEKHSMFIKIYFAVLLLPHVIAKVRVRDSLTDVMSSSALKQGLEGGGGGGGGLIPPHSRSFFRKIPCPAFFHRLEKLMQRLINVRCISAPLIDINIIYLEFMRILRPLHNRNSFSFLKMTKEHDMTAW